MLVEYKVIIRLATLTYRVTLSMSSNFSSLASHYIMGIFTIHNGLILSKRDITPCSTMCPVDVRI